LYRIKDELSVMQRDAMWHYVGIRILRVSLICAAKFIHMWILSPLPWYEAVTGFQATLNGKNPRYELILTWTRYGCAGIVSINVQTQLHQSFRYFHMIEALGGVLSPSFIIGQPISLRAVIYNPYHTDSSNNY
jgi:hypothetical protein